MLGVFTFIQILAMFLQLGNPRFKDREAAYAKLQQMGIYALPWSEAFSNHPDPEIASRSKRLSTYFVEVAIPEAGKFPYLDMLGSDVPGRNEVLRKYVAKACSEINSFASDWLAWRYATLLYVRDLKKEGVQQRDIDLLLRVMAVNEKAWWEEHNRRAEEQRLREQNDEH